MSTTYNYGALTTTFTPTRDDCSQTYIAFNTAGSWLQRGPAEESGQQACLPTGQEFGERVYYSPGICPSGFTSAAGEGIASGHSTATATCCPEGYVVRDVEFATDDPDLCATFVDTPWVATIPSYSYSGNTIAASGTTNWRFEQGTSIAARGVVIQRQESDPTWLAAAPSSTSSSSSSNKAADDGGPATNSSRTSSSSSSSPTSGVLGSQGSSTTDGQGLTQSGKIGAGVGVSLGALLILVIVFAAFRIGANRRRQRQKDLNDHQNTLSPPLPPPSQPFFADQDAMSSFHQQQYNHYNQTPSSYSPYASNSQPETAQWKHAGTPQTQTHELYQPPMATDWKQVSPQPTPPPQPHLHGYFQPPPPTTMTTTTGPPPSQFNQNGGVWKPGMHELDRFPAPLAELPYEERQRPVEMSADTAVDRH